MCDLPPEWWDLEAQSCEDSARSILMPPGRATWTGFPQSEGIKVTPVTELRGKGRARPGQEVLVISGQLMSRGTLGRGNSSLLRAQERRSLHSVVGHYHVPDYLSYKTRSLMASMLTLNHTNSYFTPSLGASMGQDGSGGATAAT